MNEPQPVETAAPVGIRRSLDVFDPQPDGVTPYTLEEVLGAAGAVYESLVGFQAALLGCMTPLSLHRQADQARRMTAQATEWFETLDAVREILERDLPLADKFPEGEGLEPEDYEWTGATHSGRSLSPSEILRLNAMVPEWPLQRLTTYRQEVERGDKVPGLIKRRRLDAERAAEEARVLNPGPDASPEQKKAAVSAKRAKTRAANRATKAVGEA
jgi:hypothetical protein